jgi:hypothetical protein
MQNALHSLILADLAVPVHENTASRESFRGQRACGLCGKGLKIRVLQIFYTVCNGHQARTLIFIPKRKKEVHGKAGGKI